MAGRAVSGAATLLGLGLERLGQWGVPKGGLIKFLANLPLSARLIGTTTPSGQVNPTGFRVKGVPGQKGGPMEYGHPLTAAHFLEVFEHFLGAVAKVTLEAGPPAVYKYTFTPDFANHKNTSFWALASLPPLIKWVLYGIMLGELAMEVGDDGVVQVRLTGEVGHGTKVGLAEPDAANTGTYPNTPWLRGVVKDKTAGSVWAYVEDPATGEFKLLQAAAKPDGAAWAAAATVFTIARNDDGLGVFQYAQSSGDGLDLGIFNENKDPLEIVWPGTAADFANAVAGDIYEFPMPGDWDDPAMSELTGYTRFTVAHLITRFREEGAGTWVEKGGFTGAVGLGWPLKVARGNPSKYPTLMYREGQVAPTIELSRDLLDTFFEGAFERHDRVEAQLVFEGEQLGTGAYRESITCTYPALAIDEHEADPGDEEAVEETTTLFGETNDNGDDPITVEVITTRNWTPTA